MPHQVGHLGHVVAQVLAHGDADGVAAPLLLVPEAPRWLQEQQQQQQQPQTEIDAPGRPQDARHCAPPGHGQRRGRQRRRREVVQQTPPACTEAPAARVAPSSREGSVIRRQGRRRGSGRVSGSCARLCGILDARGGGRRTDCEGHGCRRRAPSPLAGAGRVRSASGRTPPAPSTARFSPPQLSAALEVRWAVAGRDGQRASPMAGRRGQRGAGPPAAGRVRPPPACRPASPPPPSLRPSLPGRPARLPGSHFPPTRFAALGGQAGMERSCSRWASLPPPLPGEKRSLISRLPSLPLFRLSPQPGATYLSGRETCTKNTGFRFINVVALNPGCVTLSKLLNLSASVPSPVKRLGRIRGNA